MHVCVCIGFELCVDSCKSLILSCALFDGMITSEQACDLARLETRYQVAVAGDGCLPDTEIVGNGRGAGPGLGGGRGQG